MHKKTGKRILKKNTNSAGVRRKTRSSPVKTDEGITFKSKLEHFCSNRLNEEGIPYAYEGVTFTLMNSFICKNKVYEVYRSKKYKESSNKVGPITYTPDFVGKDWVIETKGNPNDSWPIRLKLFKKFMSDNYPSFLIFIPRTQKQVNEAIEKIKERNGTKTIL